MNNGSSRMLALEAACLSEQNRMGNSQLRTVYTLRLPCAVEALPINPDDGLFAFPDVGPRQNGMNECSVAHIVSFIYKTRAKTVSDVMMKATGRIFM